MLYSKSKKACTLFFLLCISFNSVFCQIAIDSFVNIYVEGWGQEMHAWEKAFKQSGTPHTEDVFILADVIPAIMGCDDFVEQSALTECTEKTFSRILFHQADTFIIRKANYATPFVKCRLRLDKVGMMEALEVIDEIDGKLENEILRLLSLMRGNYVTWTAQKSRSKVIGVDVYFTINFTDFMKSGE